MNSNFLYHGSGVVDLKEILPKRTLSKDKYIGDFVFATRSKLLAIMYTAVKGHYSIMNTKGKSPYIVICAEPSEYKAKDIKPVAIYKVPAESFTQSPQKELSEYELVSTIAVNTVSSEVYESSLEAFSKNRIDVYFVNKELFDKIVKAGDSGSENILKTVAKYRQD